MSWYVQALMAKELARDRAREMARTSLEREARRGPRVRSDIPPFGRIRRPLARLALAIGSRASRAAEALDPHTARRRDGRPQTTHG
jgi:hypothetical protein